MSGQKGSGQRRMEAQKRGKQIPQGAVQKRGKQFKSGKKKSGKRSY